MFCDCVRNSLIADQSRQIYTNPLQSQHGTSSKQEHAHWLDTMQPHVSSFLNVARLHFRIDCKVQTCMLDF